MSADPVRARALQTLIRVEAGAPLDSTLAGHFTRLADQRDRNLLAELVRGALQWQGRYDHVIAHFARRKPPTDPRLVCLLRLTLHQLLGMSGVPPYAAIHQAGELCKAKIAAKMVGFVNGLLQSVRRTVLADWDPTAGEPGEDPRPGRLAGLFESLGPGSPKWIAAWHSHPPWLVERWCDRYGSERAAKICARNNEPVLAVLQVLAPADPAALAEQLAEEGVQTGPGPREDALVPARRLPQSEWNDLLARHPELIVQDPVVREATEWLATDLEGETAEPLLLDLCAAPGGKTAILAAVLAENWRLLAADFHPGRVRRLAGTLERVATRPVPVLTADGTRPPFASGTFDAVLLDGPCSGTGVLRHHPEGRWRLTPETVTQNGERLLELALAAADLLAPGGHLLYATCSLEPEENERVLERLRAERSDLRAVAPEGGLRAWTPDRTGGDGFFAARLRKRSETTTDRGEPT